MQYSLGISDFLEEISSLSYCIVFLYFFALITKEGFLISPCYFLELCFLRWVYLSFSPLSLASFDFGGNWDLITKLTQDWGNRLLEGTYTKPCAPQDPGERKSDPTSHSSS